MKTSHATDPAAPSTKPLTNTCRVAAPIFLFRLNFKMARDAQSRGFLPNRNIDQSLATPGGFLPSRRPDYLFGGAGFTTSNPSAQVREPTATPVNS